MIDISTSKLFEILPESIKNDEDIQAAAIAVDRSTGDIYSLSRKLDFRSNKNIKDHEILDELAVDLHVDFYDKNLHADVKREIIDNSIIQHMEKGTAGAVERALANIGVTGEVVEWSEYGGKPFYFRVFTENLFLDIDVETIAKVIHNFKNTRSWLEDITVKRELDLGLNIGGATSNYLQTHISPPKFEMPDLQSNLFYGALVSKHEKTEITAPHFTMPNFTINQSLGGAFSSWRQTTIFPTEEYNLSNADGGLFGVPQVQPTIDAGYFTDEYTDIGLDGGAF